MAKQNQKNQLRYTGLTYDSIKRQFEAVIQSDPRFENFTQSSLYKLISDLFIGATDITNYYIERQAEESYLDTAQHLSSVILNASQIGYVVRRPLGAKSSLAITVKGPIPTALPGSNLAISKFTSFNYNGNPYILTFAYTHKLTNEEAYSLKQPTGSITFNAAEVDNAAGGTDTVNIEILQGEVKELQILPGTQVGKKFQKYNIDDPSFSNYYGEEDLGGGKLDSELNLTRVFINDEATPNENGTEYHINRRSLTAEQYTVDTINAIVEDDSGELTVESVKTCLLKTNKDTTIDLLFGDGKATAIGANPGQIIKVQYFSVQGDSVNATGLVGKPLELDGNITLDNININTNSEFKFYANLLGGANIEDKESIRVNAPAIFQSLDRLVTKSDYKSFTKSIVTPLPVQYSVVWGETEEAKRKGVRAVYALFNSIMISAMGAMYKYENGNWLHKDILFNTSAYNGSGKSTQEQKSDYDTTFIEGFDDMNSNTNLMNQAYFNLYIKTGIVDYMNYIYNDDNAPTNVKTFLNQIYKRSQVTVKNIYLPPIVQGFELQGDVIIKPFSDILQTQTDIQNTLYKQLNTVLQFETPVYVSQITDLINSFDDVKYSNLKLVPIDVNPGTKMTTTSASVISTPANYAPATTALIETAANTTLASYLTFNITTSSDLDIDTVNNLLVDDDGTAVSDKFTQKQSHARIKNINERSFYDNFAQPFYVATSAYNDISGKKYNESIDFKLYIDKVNAMMKLSIRNGMLDVDGNIINFSFGNEIPLIINKTSVKHK